MSRAIVPSASTSAIYGDANTQQATYLPDLNSIANDPYVGVTADSSNLNIFQKLNIKDNVYDTRTEIQYPTINSRGNVVFQFNLMGWSNAREMCIEIPVTFKLKTPISQGFPAYQTGVTNTSTIDDPLKWSMGNYCLLSYINRFEIYMGNNNQPIGKSQQWSTLGIKVAATDQKYDENLEDYMGLLGLPVSQWLTMATASGFNTLGVDNVDWRILRSWKRMFESFNISTTNTTGSNITSLTLRIPIPLCMISYFFKSNTYLPPGLKFKFDIGYNAEANLLGFKADAATDAGTASNWCQVTINPNEINQQWRVVYFNHTLRQPLQQQINLKWVSTPFLYNYETLEYYETAGDDASSTLTLNIAVSQQRPTQLLFGIFNNENNLYYSGFVGATPTVDQVQTQLWQQPGFVRLTANTNVDPDTIKSMGNMEFPQCLVNHPGIQQIEVTIAGRAQYYYNNNQNNYGGVATSVQKFYSGSMPSGQDFIFSEASRKAYLNYNVDGGVGTNLNQFASGAIASLKTLTIAPGNEVDRANIPSDLGAHTIRVQITFFAPLQKYQKLVVFKKMPEQIALDASQNCTLVMWPAVKSQTGYLIPSTTSVTN